MLHSLKHYRLLHERVVLVSVLVDDVPVVDAKKRVELEKLGKGFFAVKLHYGFFEYPDVPKSLEAARPYGLVIDPETTTFFVGREMLVPASRPILKPWRIGLYTWLASNAYSPARYYRLPPNRVVELGTQVSI
jgi:KUP system potassium uptake protein